MRRFLLTFLLGMVAGAGGYWYFDQAGMNPDAIHEASGMMSDEAAKIKATVQEKFQDWSTTNIQEELARTGMVIREKATQAKDVIWDATADARIAAAIKSKLLADSWRGGWRIQVDSADGLVTLSGVATSTQQVERAVQLALDTDGVNKVVSTVQVGTLP